MIDPEKSGAVVALYGKFALADAIAAVPPELAAYVEELRVEVAGFDIDWTDWRMGALQLEGYLAVRYPELDEHAVGAVVNHESWLRYM